MNVQCFLVVDAGRVRISLRRYAGEEKCPLPFGYHNAENPIGESEAAFNPQGYVEPGPEVPHDDPRWPRHCACGFAFREDDPWQRNDDPLYRRADLADGDLWTIRDLPPGAMWDAWWMRGRRKPFPPEGGRLWCGPDGLCLTVKLPNGIDWHIDGPATNAPGQSHGWERTGPLPVITVRPSILASDYHGFLTMGDLVPC